MWLLQNGIGYGISGVKNPSVLNTRETAPVVSFPARVRVFCAARFQTLMGDEGSLAMAMLLGDKDGLAEEEQLAFQRAGVAHLMAVSGLHAWSSSSHSGNISGSMGKYRSRICRGSSGRSFS